MREYESRLLAKTSLIGGRYYTAMWFVPEGDETKHCRMPVSPYEIQKSIQKIGNIADIKESTRIRRESWKPGTRENKTLISPGDLVRRQAGKPLKFGSSKSGVYYD